MALCGSEAQDWMESVLKQPPPLKSASYADYFFWAGAAAGAAGTVSVMSTSVTTKLKRSLAHWLSI